MVETVAPSAPTSKREYSQEERQSVVISFSGDSGDGMQLTGGQFTNTSAVVGNDVSTFPDIPAEIRAPAGTIPGLSGYQVNFAANDLYTAGDSPQVLVAMNPAALKANLPDLEPGGTIIVNTDPFNRNGLRKAGYEANPLEDGSLSGYDVHPVPLTTLTRNALADIEGMSNQAKDMCKNAFVLGLVFWMFDRPLDYTLKFYQTKFAGRPEVVEANTRALKAGYYYGETAETFQTQISVPKRQIVEPGVYKRITGNDAIVLGLVTAAQKAGKPFFYGSYPITPASTILEGLAALKNFDVRTFQAEDEIAAMGSVIGAAFAGSLAATASSGPGIALKSEGINLAVVMELPLVVIDVQRGGPSTGLPTKTEQADLLEVLYGRNGESPIPVIAPATPSECFDMIIEAFRIAVRYMTPVFVLSDGYVANNSEPWKIPDPDSIAAIDAEPYTDPDDYQPYMRDPQTLARPWVLPGTPGLEHRIGGLGKQDVTGNVSYAPEDHERIVHVRADKIRGIADFIPELEVTGPDQGDLLVLGWGGTYGAIRAAVEQVRDEGLDVAYAHLRYLNPFPRNLGNVLGRYKQVLVPELNLGQLALLVQAHFPVRVVKLNKVQGAPFQIREVADKIRQVVS
ncbi:MAG: 2-oxoacid:acceptor oxidoreductase subunit alpha [Gemmatimonadetes bacterium]|nr:2-oxoacid:acceptor oxidoreductase subunit alpha [Gemmatimonadota bacterium]MDE2733990.1 2-oxoacid:acceptor oxidoreductase subunit alpha [Gemmatimonadota bacterium]